MKQFVRHRGSALVEMAIVVPILALLTVGLIEYGWIFFRISQINQAARQGVRVAVRPDATTDNVKNSVTAMMQEAGLQNSGYKLGYSDIDVGVGQAVSVEIIVDYSKLSLTGARMLPMPQQIVARATMSKERAPTSP